MKYWMSFADNNNEEVWSISDKTFLGRDLDITELKDRFNRDFIKRPGIKGVEITFMGKGINRSFIAGFKNKHVVIIDLQSKREYTAKEFSVELNILDAVLNPKAALIS
jgi:hypothetical protein